jgi:drug/metabolite transporter (DMT)-like permease
VAFLRLALSCLLFSPWLLRHRLRGRSISLLLGLGAVQFGLMYAFYIASFAYLPAYAVAFFTIFTPLYVTVLCDVLARRLLWRHLIASLLAVGGAALVLARGVFGREAIAGVMLLQAANLCFALGQVGYRRLFKPAPQRGSAPVSATGQRVAEATLHAWMYTGATAITGLAALLGSEGRLAAFDRQAALVLLYLGAVPTGLGFYLWNKGAARVGAGVLAVCNNLKIPLAVVCAWLVFGEPADHLRVLGGLGIILAALMIAGGPGSWQARTGG